MSLLILIGVAGARGGRTVFDGVDVTLTAGDAACVSGPNGAGKSTLLRIAAGLLAPAAGSVARPGAAAWLGEAAALDGERTLAGALMFWAQADGLPEPAERVARGLAAVALTGLAMVPVRFLSTGQRRRAALARVVASTAALWLLDEPANGLDMASVTALERVVADHRAGGGAVLVATHQPIDLPGAQRIILG